MSVHLTFLRVFLLGPWLWLLSLPGPVGHAPAPMIDYPTEWRKADSLMAKGLPKSALEIADRLYAEAKKTNNQPQLLKAAMRRVVFRTQAAKDEETYVTLTRELAADIAETNGATRAVLQSVLADVYWQFYQNNRYRFFNRTSTAPGADVAGPDSTDVSTDPRTWDTRRLMQTITTLYRASLEPAVLQKTPLTTYDVILTPGNEAGRQLRPTLYDVLVQRAIGFFANSENDLTKPINAFDLNDPTYLSDPEAFVGKTLPTTDTLSGKYQALALYQQLIRLHQADKDPLALAVIDVERLQFVRQSGTLPNERDLMEQTLRRQMARYKNQPAEAEYALALVQLLAQPDGVIRNYIRGRGNVPSAGNTDDSTRRWDRKTAAELARDLIARFPKSYPAQQAQPLLNNLYQPTLSVQTEAVNEPNKPFRARVDFQNVKTLFYKLLRLTPDELLALENSGYNDDDSRDRWFATLQKHTIVAQGQLTLPDDGDLRAHSTEVPMNALPLGHYALLVSNEGRFAKPSEKRAEIVSIGKVVVSNLAYVQAGANQAGVPTMFVTNRQTGAPLANVTATVMVARDRSGRSGYVAEATRKADAQGRLTLDRSQLPDQSTYLVRFTSGSDVLDTEVFYSYGRYGQPDAPEARDADRAAIFTDRAIYRPGQTIFFKTLLYRGKDNNFTVRANQSVTIRLNDANGEEVGKAELKTNEFGTASGTFTAPVGRLTGEMTLLVDRADGGGQATVRVEEYKRPTFAVVAEPMKQAPVLGQAVTVQATAKTLAGAVVDGANVTYRVTRTYIQPYWYWWRSYRPNAGQEQEIANGTATTNADGTVSLTFTAVPDASIAAVDKPRFTYTVNIDVTDRSGETRSTTQTLSIGYTALTASLPLPNPVLTTDKKTYSVGLTNASNVPVTLKSGTVRLARLESPRNGALLRNRLWEKPDRTTLTRAEFEKQFPLDLYADEDNPATWAKTTVRTEPAKAVSLAGLTPGLYEAAIDATDSTGKTATDAVFFTVIDPQKPTAPVRSGEFVQVQKATAQPGEEVVFWIGTRQPGHVLMAVEEKGKIVRQEWITTTEKPAQITLPVAEKHRGGFAVHFAMVQNGRLLTRNETIAVPFTNKQLTIETETFRDKLQPGQAEQWTLRVSGPNQDKVLGELVATLYDASLDQFVAHNWPTTFYQPNSALYDYWVSSVFRIAITRQYWYPPQPASGGNAQRNFPELSWGPYQYIPYTGRFAVLIQPEPARIELDYAKNVVKGRITTDDKQTPLPGASVLLKGTKQGVNTDADGRFTLTIPTAQKNPVLVFGYVGYAATEVALGTKRKITALMPITNGFSNEVVMAGYGRQEGGLKMSVRGRASADMAMAAPAAMAERKEKAEGEAQPAPAPNQPATTDVAQPVIRTNFNETAFFFPQLQTDAQGRVVLKFTMPDALTSWRLLAFAHTKTMQTGSFEATVQTQKELMVTTNVPRFLRENDTLRLTARIDNLSGKPLAGTATLTLTDALTGESLTTKMGLRVADVSFSAKAGQNSVATWNLVVPQGLPPVAVRVTARAGTFTDGEERVVPVLPNRILVTDVQPFWIDGGTPTAGDKGKTFRLKALADHNPELPLQTERYTVEVTSNPAWYALQTLPYLMEYQYDCAEQLFSKLYANALGAHILNSRPAFRQVVDAWKQTPPKSPLAKNDELKAVVLENTPWLADAKSEAERTAKLGRFFDQNNLVAQQRRAIAKLRQLQDADGGLMWFSGMRPNVWMTMHVLAGLGHLQKLGVRFESDVQADVKTLQASAIRYVDAEAQRLMAEEKRLAKTKVSNGSYWAATYLYARSFYLTTNPVDKGLQTYLLPAIQKGWSQSNLQGQALAAVTLYRYGLKPDALAILQSLTERSKLSDELGLYWPDNVSGTYWYQAPIETQAYLIEAYLEAGTTGDGFAWYRKQPAFAKTTGNQVFIDKMRQWLIQQKRTQSWPSTKATTEAVYALLLTGTDWLDTKNTVTVRVGGQDIAKRSQGSEALTGYQKVTFAPAEVTPQLGVIEVSRSAGASAKTGISWGAAYWQHFEPMDAVGRSGPGNLNVKKTLFRQRNTAAGPVLEPINPKSPLKPGDLLSVRVVLTTDRVMEYVHLKDGRASGFEPVAALSGTKYQNGLSYYEAPRDASTDFFIEYLPTGTHVFEYKLRVVHAGDFGTGVATVQCFYAPEFAAHSSGGRVQVQ
ncbi:alpha-2-macroglobulin family protein [Fibrella sp. WM1]|uniref:alpha-2-macroglobulin family protein n=1 Tax=Fibrella musci TaxID=3242485 RepID=UPI00352012C9